ASFLLDALDRRAANNMDATNGINNSLVFIEWYNSNLDGFGSSNKMQIGDSTWMAGLAFELCRRFSPIPSRSLACPCSWAWAHSAQAPPTSLGLDEKHPSQRDVNRREPSGDVVASRRGATLIGGSRQVTLSLRDEVRR